MSIPSNDKVENAVSSLGIETYPQSIIVKGSLWSLHIANGRLVVKDYSGYSEVLAYPIIKKYRLTRALRNDLSVDTNRFWVWGIDYLDTVSLYELEPYTSVSPEITYSKLGILSSVNSLSAYIQADDVVRLSVLYTNNDFKSISYENIRDTAPPIEAPMLWSGTRTDEFSTYAKNDQTSIDLLYLDVASPPNVYVDSYTVDTPLNLLVSQVGSTPEISISWSAATGADSYALDIADNPSFTAPVSVTTSFLTYSYSVPLTGTYYCRVRGLDSLLLLQSPWSSTEDITIILTAEFSGTPLLEYTGDNISFTDSSTPVGIISSWLWDFGDGETSALQNPVHVYANSGWYTVSLTVYSGLDSDTETKSSYVQIVAPLVAEFIGNPLLAYDGDTVSFTDQSTPVGTISSWFWNFGDGETSTLQNPNHIYVDPGWHTVSLIVYGAIDPDTETKPSYIHILVSLVASFTASPTQGDANLFVEFIDTSLGEPASWDWDFGDGSPHSAVQYPVHVYTRAGVFTVNFTVSDGETQSTATPVDIEVEMVTDFTMLDAIGPADLTVQFTDITLGTPTTWLWDFGDGFTSTEQNPSHTYTHPGHYTISLVASNSEKTDTEIKVDAVTVYTNAEFSGTPRTGYSSALVQFVDESTGFPTSWFWDFGDGNTATNQNPQHQYVSPGKYTVSLMAASAFNGDVETKVEYIDVSGVATPDIAPEPDILMYMSGPVESSRSTTGVRIYYHKKI